MRAFTTLIGQLHKASTQEDVKSLLLDYFAEHEIQNNAYTIALLSGKSYLKKLDHNKLLEWMSTRVNIPLWLTMESNTHTNYLPTTLSLLNRNNKQASFTLSEVIHNLLKLEDMDGAQVAEYINSIWDNFEGEQLQLVNELLCHFFKSPLYESLLFDAVSEYYCIPKHLLADIVYNHLHQGNYPDGHLLIKYAQDNRDSYRIPFHQFMTSIAPAELPTSLTYTDYYVHHQPEGLQVHLLVDQAITVLYNVKGEVITHYFPEIVDELNSINHPMRLEATIIASVQATNQNEVLHKRLNKRYPDKKMIAQQPVQVVVTDLLSYDGEDLSGLDFEYRYELMSRLISEWQKPILLACELSPLSDSASLECLVPNPTNYPIAALMLKSKYGRYNKNDSKDQWYSISSKRKLFTGVLLYIQRIAINEVGVTYDMKIAAKKADSYIGITSIQYVADEAESVAIEEFIKNNTLEKFGPVMSVKAELIFEIQYEKVIPSKRHKSGIQLYSPSNIIWNRQKNIYAIDSIESLHSFIA